MELTIHAQAEEEIFYPAVHAAIGDEDLMDEADVEHAGAKNLIAQLDREFSISVSISLCALTEVDGEFAHVLCHADNACYEAKKKGRNRIHAFTYSSPKCVELSSLNC